MLAKLQAAVGQGALRGIAATDLASQLLGNSIYSNILLLGFAFQQGAVPLSLAALEAALVLHNVDVEQNKAAFTWGRLLAVHPDLVRAPHPEPAVETTDQLAARCHAELVDYQDRAYADRYARLLDRVQAADRRIDAGSGRLTRAVAQNYFKLLAYKDEYEVARHYTGETFRRALAEQFDGSLRVRLHLAPPLLSRMDAATGRPKKRSFGPWISRCWHCSHGKGAARHPIRPVWLYTRTARRTRVDLRLRALHRGSTQLSLRIDLRHCSGTCATTRPYPRLRAGEGAVDRACAGAGKRVGCGARIKSSKVRKSTICKTRRQGRAHYRIGPRHRPQRRA